MNSRKLAAPPLSLGVVLFVLTLTGCAGNGEGLDANGRPLSGGSPPPPLSADFDSIQANIFTPICSVCHVGGGAPEGLRLDAANSYNLLVGVPSTEVPSLMRVKPGDPDDSYIIQKLEGHAAVGAQMPLGGPFLTTDTIAFIRQWITNGAAASSTPAAVNAAALAVTAVVPNASEPVDGPPPQIMLAFNHELDMTQLGTHAIRIERLGADGPPVTESMPARLSISGANLRALMIWPAQPLAAGRYRVVIDANSSAQFSDIAGRSVVVGTPDERGDSVISTFDVRDVP
ncbi:MAG TPA: hypothetical protein VHW71_03985 [Steroidobacteraceae bacterium]|jgi:hypothetical protein|nr:hypothetical protein [Steroidobacteraceae bacterium]